MKIIRNAFLVTMNPKRDVYLDGAIAIDGNRIADVGKSEDIARRYPDAETLDASGHALIPGLVAAHVHLFQSLYRGIGTDMPLADWLSKGIWPLSEYLGCDECRTAALLAAAELIKSGTTTFVDSHYINKDKRSIDGLAESIDRIGMRGSLCRTCVDGASLAPHFRETPEEAAREAARVIGEYDGSSDGRIHIRVEALNEQLASPELIRSMYETSREYGVGMSMHLAETATRAAWIREKFNRSPLEYLNDLGVLGPHMLLAHCVWITARDIELLGATDTRVAYNAVSNQYLADGVAPIPEMLERGVCVAIGPDGAASNNNLDMFETMKSAILSQRANRLTMTNLDAEKALEMATIDGARAIGLDAEIGSLEAGKKADLILVDLERLEMTPNIGTVSNLVYAASGSSVKSAMIDGRWVLKDGELTTVDEKKIVADANRTALGMIGQAGTEERMYRGTWHYI